MLYGTPPDDTQAQNSVNEAYNEDGTDLDLLYDKERAREEQRQQELQEKQQQQQQQSQCPAETITKNLAILHLQDIDGLSAALDVSDNGHFDLLPVSCSVHFVPDKPKLKLQAAGCSTFP